MSDPFTFIPNKKQAEFLSTNADICLMGGGVGSGKTLAAVILMLRLNDKSGPGYLNPRYNALICRRHYKDLRDIISKTKQIYPKIDPGAEFKASDLLWVFSSGAIIQLAHFDNIDACISMTQGAEYATALIDECMHFDTDEIFLYLMSRLRNSYGMKPLMRLTSNPGRYRWLREFFRIDDDGNSTDFKKEYELEDGTVIEKRIKYIQAKLSDNPHIPKDYEATIMMMNNEDVQALLHGKWNAYSSNKGSIYNESLSKAQREQRICKVPYDSNLTVYCVMDLGRNDTNPIIFAQTFGKEIRIFGYYENNGHHISHYFDLIQQKKYPNTKIILPHDAKSKTVGAEYSVEEQAITTFGRHNVEVLPREDIELGISTTKRMLDNTYIDESLTRLLEVIENYKRKYNKSLGIYEAPLHDEYSNGADALRYLAMHLSNSKPKVQFEAPKPMPFFGFGHN